MPGLRAYAVEIAVPGLGPQSGSQAVVPAFAAAGKALPGIAAARVHRDGHARWAIAVRRIRATLPPGSA